MKLLEHRQWEGPTYRHNKPVTLVSLSLISDFAQMDVAALESYLADQFPEFDAKARSTLHIAGAEEAPALALLPALALIMQNASGTFLSQGSVTITENGSQAEVWFEHETLTLGTLAMRLSASLFKQALDSLGYKQSYATAPLPPFASMRERFLRQGHTLGIDDSARDLIRAAEAMNLPWFRMHEGEDVIQFGLGAAAQRFIETLTDATGVLAKRASSFKGITPLYLEPVGVPFPAQQVVQKREGALAAAKKIGYPVVLKPNDGKGGAGITLNVRDDQTLTQAFERASKKSASVLIQKFVEGYDHRLLVVGEEMVAAALSKPASVTGDGTQTVRELIEDQNRRQRRRDGYGRHLVNVRLDDIALAQLKEQDLGPDDVPVAGREVRLRQVGNMSSGGSSEDVTDEVHPDNRDLAIHVAQYLGIDVAGIDLLSPDISVPWHENGAVMIEANTCPGLRPHWFGGKDRQIAKRILENYFSGERPGRIPIAAITGSDGKTTTTRLTAHLMKQTGKRIGRCESDGVYIGDRQVARGDMAGFRGGRAVITHPKVEVAVLETARGGLLTSGAAFPVCSVGAVLNVNEDHVGMAGVETREALAQVKSIVPRLAEDYAVLNAGNDLSLAMRDQLGDLPICLFASSPESPEVAATLSTHLNQGGRASMVEPNQGAAWLVLAEGSTRHPLLPVEDLPLLWEGRALHHLDNALAAAAITWCLGLDPERIATGLASFQPDATHNQGRLNLVAEEPIQVVLDFAHNPTEVEAAVKAVKDFKPDGGRHCFLSAPATRSEDFYTELARVVAPHFDHFTCSNWTTTKGRPVEKVPSLLMNGLLAAGVEKDRIHSGVASFATMDEFLRSVPEGGFALVFGNNPQIRFPRILSTLASRAGDETT